LKHKLGQLRKQALLAQQPYHSLHHTTPKKDNDCHDVRLDRRNHQNGIGFEDGAMEDDNGQYDVLGGNHHDCCLPSDFLRDWVNTSPIWNPSSSTTTDDILEKGEEIFPTMTTTKTKTTTSTTKKTPSSTNGGAAVSEKLKSQGAEEETDKKKEKKNNHQHHHQDDDDDESRPPGTAVASAVVVDGSNIGLMQEEETWVGMEKIRAGEFGANMLNDLKVPFAKVICVRDRENITEKVYQDPPTTPSTHTQHIYMQMNISCDVCNMLTQHMNTCFHS
jgi:hypothetical protein